MPIPTIVPVFNFTNPAATAGFQNTHWQSNGGNPVAFVTTEVPNTGNVNIRSAAFFYAIVPADCGKLVVYDYNVRVGNFSLPDPPPFPQWTVSVTNLTAYNLIVGSTGSVKFDGVAAGGVNVNQFGSVIIYTDGTDYYSIRGDRVNIYPYHVVNFLPGLPPNASFQVLQWTCPADPILWNGVTFPADFAGSKGFCQAPPASGATYLIYQVPAGSPPGTPGTGIGSIQIATTTGIFTFSTISHIAYNFVAGDTMVILAPSPADSTLAGVGFSLAGFR